MEDVPVAELKPRTPCGDPLAVAHGDIRLEEIDVGQMTLLSVLGSSDPLSAALEAAHGMGFPAPNRTSGKAGARCVWFGRNQALLIGPAADATLARHAALVDQSDAWCAVSLTGASSEDVLARLVPLDLRAGRFKRGHTARSQLGHMQASITRTGTDSFMILVFRSMAASLIQELSHAMQAVAARRGR